MEPYVMKFQLQSWADQLKSNAVTLNLSKQYIPQEQVEEVEKAIARNRELAEMAMQKAKELQEIG